MPGRPPRARKPSQQADLRRGSRDSTESPGPESAPGATGCEMGEAGRTVDAADEKVLMRDAKAALRQVMQKSPNRRE